MTETSQQSFSVYHLHTSVVKLFGVIVFHKQTDQLSALTHRRKMKKEDTVKLISAEGFEFIIDKKAAMVSQTIRNMLTSPGSFAETEHGEVTFPEISTTILEKICQYFYWSLQYASGKETEFHIEPEITLELMMAANYLHT
ncbi:hypothetical protein K7X08_003567 [Anisodus acutangulus]|uniref:Elongin-C n=1 Tax=Anisodus acutangulus TaxID=402998 RepID=A0A9Q1MJH0_9SOLA|nr:hypothetical protein K7X08_003567 [Anisodus acutangulus]